MLKDPWMEWEDGIFPYDILAATGVTPDSSMPEIRETALRLMAQGEFSRARRAAWDELRHVERRLWLDLWLHIFSSEEIAEALEVMQAKAEPVPAIPETEHLLSPNLEDLKNMEVDFAAFDETIPDLDPMPASIAPQVEFDS